MENKFVKKGTYVELRETQRELLKKLINLNKVKIYPRKNYTKETFDDLAKELIKLHKIMKTFSSNQYIAKTDNKTIFDNLDDFNKLLNDRPGVKLDFSYRNDYTVQPLLKLNKKAFNRLSDELDNIKSIVFNERKQELSLKNINMIKEGESLQFSERDNKINMDKINGIESAKSINFKELDNKINMDKINGIEPAKSIIFNERNNKINMDKIKFIEPAKPINFEEFDTKIKIDNILGIKSNINPDDFKIDYDINKEETYKYIDKNYDIIDSKIKSIEKTIVYFTRINKDLQIRIRYFNMEMDETKIKETVEQFLIIEETNELEIEKVDGFNEKFKIPLLPEEDTKVILKGKVHDLTDNDYYGDAQFIENVFKQKGGLSQKNGYEKYIEVSLRYNKLIKERQIINELRKTIDEYNLIYIQNYYYQLYILQNINKFHKNKREIYKFISKSSVLDFLEILDRINDIISTPDKLFTEIESRQRTVHMIFFYRYYIVIKILFNFLKSVKTLWDDKNINPNYKINVLIHDNQVIQKYLIIFNLFYPIIAKYGLLFIKSKL